MAAKIHRPTPVQAELLSQLHRGCRIATRPSRNYAGATDYVLEWELQDEDGTKAWYPRCFDIPSKTWSSGYRSSEIIPEKVVQALVAHGLLTKELTLAKGA